MKGGVAGFGVPFGSRDVPFGGRGFGWGVRCCSAGFRPNFCLGLASWARSCRAVGDTGVVFWVAFIGLVWSFCGLLQLGGEFASFLISLLWQLGSV